MHGDLVPQAKPIVMCSGKCVVAGMRAKGAILHVRGAAAAFSSHTLPPQFHQAHIFGICSLFASYAKQCALTVELKLQQRVPLKKHVSQIAQTTHDTISPNASVHSDVAVCAPLCMAIATQHVLACSVEILNALLVEMHSGFRQATCLARDFFASSTNRAAHPTRFPKAIRLKLGRMSK